MNNKYLKYTINILIVKQKCTYVDAMELLYNFITDN